MTTHATRDRRRRAIPRLVAVVIIASASPARADETNPSSSPGARIYQKLCVSCHGTNGEGTPDDYPRALVGDRSIDQLTRLIEKTMPEDDPEACVAEDARAVATYIHDAFYSRVAQARNAPPRVELARLTVREYRNALTDLVGTFRPDVQWGDERGLKAEYYKGRRMRGGDRVLNRVDPTVSFDFQESSPDPEKLDPVEFSIRWEGSVLAQDSGEHEFIVRTEHAARLWVNDTRTPLIDAWVKSGDDKEYRASIRLLGGRAYPIRLEFSKAKQGVDDSKKQKRKPKPVQASIALLWTPPGKAVEVIPERCLSTDRNPESFVVTTPFPPDDRSVGYERGTTVSRAWENATTDAAIETAAHVLANLRALSGVGESDSDRVGKLKAFCRTFVERAFRRPVSDSLAELYVDRQFQEARTPETAVKRVVLLTLKSPRFLYHEVGGDPGPTPDPHDVASRLSFALWDSIPDEPLLKAASQGGLSTVEQVTAQAKRMVGDLRSRSKVREFLLQWLRVDQPPDLSKDPERFPGFDAAVAADLRTSLELFLEEAVWGESSDFRQLLTGNTTYLNGRLSAIYGGDLPADAPFTKVALEPEARAGVFSHPYLLATFAYTSSSSPIHRGVFLARSVLGRALRPPPEAAAPIPADLHPGLTTRERVALQTRPVSCATCHNLINPLGFTLERFDAIGRYRERENDRPVDSSGTYQTRSGETVTFEGAGDLAAFLAETDETRVAFVEQLFQFLVRQPIRAFGPDASPDLRKRFDENGCRVRELLVEIAVKSALRRGEPASTPRAE
ncbi:MAG: DUF1592 domain-containing protein [Isosphaeraceae bacterium]